MPEPALVAGTARCKAPLVAAAPRPLRLARGASDQRPHRRAHGCRHRGGRRGGGRPPLRRPARLTWACACARGPRPAQGEASGALDDASAAQRRRRCRGWRGAAEAEPRVGWPVAAAAPPPPPRRRIAAGHAGSAPTSLCRTAVRRADQHRALVAEPRGARAVCRCAPGCCPAGWQALPSRVASAAQQGGKRCPAARRRPPVGRRRAIASLPSTCHLMPPLARLCAILPARRA